MRRRVGLWVAVIGSVQACGEIREVPVEDEGTTTSTASTTTQTGTSGQDTEMFPPGVSDGDTEELPTPDTDGSASTTSSSPTSSTGEPQQRVSFCSELDLAIPTGMNMPATTEMTVEDARSIVDLDLMVRINHEAPTGLAFNLTRLDGDPLPLLDGADSECHNPGGVIFDDDSSIEPSQWCNVRTSPPVVMPAGALSNYADETIGGTWILEVRDRNEGTSGTITKWCLSAVLD